MYNIELNEEEMNIVSSALVSYRETIGLIAKHTTSAGGKSDVIAYRDKVKGLSYKLLYTGRNVCHASKNRCNDNK